MTRIPEKIKENMMYTMEQMSIFCPRIILKRTSRVFRYESDIVHSMYNRVIAYQGGLTEDTLIDIARIANSYRTNNVPFTWLTWSHDADVADLTFGLAANGLKKVGDMSGMSLSLTDWRHDAPDIPGFVIKPIQNRSEMDWFQDIVPPVFDLIGEAGNIFVRICEAAAFGENAVFRHYIGFLDGQPVSAVTAVQQGDTIGIYNVAVREAYRRKGFGSAMTAHAVRQGQAAGGRLAVLQASKMGESVYRDLGFSADMAIELFQG
ncbi:GNAT family N-acetyltransferase [Paenibacillus sacheonensis]|uniref:GNAT family N-acetyltransferase n=1 Tax=Paenibacillus sacheonensis TaxID=742054 RepID=A0A7X5BZJ7_9BACL|nr:GNAT family N-acetyltransferase [Paenibacillus sacheonensis]MBM7569068.1 ribosomal protein S18 acetylase RimI-like enzyme [Paenibacillus sacheonensis]NBC72753.1 GNAT family N-acetyltransferase [Paenibacillus sacheonensis]